MGGTWCLDELVVTIQGRRDYLWRAVDQDGERTARASRLIQIVTVVTGLDLVLIQQLTMM